MRKFALLFCLALIGLRAAGQSQAETFIQEAKDLLAQKSYKQAVLSLQDAINEINTLIAQQVSESLPAEINGLKADGAGEVNAAGMGMVGGGMQISKRYENPSNNDQEADVQIIANAPMLSALNMYITNPSMMGPGYKSVRVGTNRAILKSEMQDGGNGQIRSTEIQIPLGQTLVTIQTRGLATEQDELAFANKLGLDKIKAALGE